MKMDVSSVSRALATEQMRSRCSGRQRDNGPFSPLSVASTPRGAATDNQATATHVTPSTATTLWLRQPTPLESVPKPVGRSDWVQAPPPAFSAT